MYPIWLVKWAGESLVGECLAGSKLNVDAPACQTGASWANIELLGLHVGKSNGFDGTDMSADGRK